MSEALFSRRSCIKHSDKHEQTVLLFHSMVMAKNGPFTILRSSGGRIGIANGRKLIRVCFAHFVSLSEFPVAPFPLLCY